MNLLKPFKSRKRLWTLGALLLVVALGSGAVVRELGLIVTGFVAKQTCSLVNITGLSLEAARAELGEQNSLANFVKTKVDHETGGVRASLFGWIRSEAVYRKPYGATLVFPKYRKRIESFPLPTRRERIDDETQVFRSETPRDTPWDDPIRRDQLNAAMAYAFDEPEGVPSRRTRAALVVWRDHVIAERYADGYSKDSLFLGWSMTKSVLNLAVGLRVAQGKMSLEESALFESWTDESRRSIDLEDLLRMQSGLEFREVYDPFGDPVRMLYRSPNMPGYAGQFKRSAEATHEPKFHYSSGSSNLVSAALRSTFQSDQEYVDFLWRDLFGSLGIKTIEIEFDAAGHWVASSYLYTTARNWARFGRLMLQDGVWNGERLLPEGWVGTSVTPTASYPDVPEPGDPPGSSYGMHWWLNRERNGVRWMPGVPEDTIVAWGFNQQFLVIIPSQELIVVRLGFTPELGKWDQGEFLRRLLGQRDGTAQ